MDILMEFMLFMVQTGQSLIGNVLYFQKLTASLLGHKDDNFEMLLKYEAEIERTRNATFGE